MVKRYGNLTQIVKDLEPLKEVEEVSHIANHAFPQTVVLWDCNGCCSDINCEDEARAAMVAAALRLAHALVNSAD